MRVFAIETWHHSRRVLSSDGDLIYETGLTAIKSSIEDAMSFCRGNPDYAGRRKDNGTWDWHWTIREYKLDAGPEEDQDIYSLGTAGAHHILPDGHYCSVEGSPSNLTGLWGKKTTEELIEDASNCLKAIQTLIDGVEFVAPSELINIASFINTEVETALEKLEGIDDLEE